MNKELIARAIKDIVGSDNIRTDEPMRNHTSFKVGGPADIMVIPDSVEKLASVLKICNQETIPFFVMGNGSNLVVRDKGIRGVVIKLFDNFNRFSVCDEVIEAQSGILLSRVSKIALENGLTGLEFAEGIPGTLGGAVYMNAGAYIGEMADVVVETEYMDTNGELRIIKGNQHQFGYRSSFIQKQTGIVLKSIMKLKKGNKNDIKALMDDFNKKRRDKQPLELPSAGSVFKRPTGYFAGKLIEDCGLRGYRIGGAEVSTKHCGFIVNIGNSSCQDILDLIEHIQSCVKDRFNVELSTEVKLVGEE